MSKEQDFFDKFGLEIKHVPLENIQLNKEYPLYGYITEVLENTPDIFQVLINGSIKAILPRYEEDKRQIILSRIYEPGIFIVKFYSYTDTNEEIKYSCNCSCIIFGKQQGFNA